VSQQVGFSVGHDQPHVYHVPPGCPCCDLWVEFFSLLLSLKKSSPPDRLLLDIPFEADPSILVQALTSSAFAGDSVGPHIAVYEYEQLHFRAYSTSPGVNRIVDFADFFYCQNLQELRDYRFVQRNFELCEVDGYWARLPGLYLKAPS
jgi:hypothetical protein